MFPCACSLRSTQCAALIALAAAAGVMRIEGKQVDDSSKSQPRNELTQTQAGTASRSLRSVFHVVGDSGAPWLLLLKAAAQPAAAAEFSTDIAGEPAATAIVVACQPDIPTPSAREHVFPYAVGPPHPDLAATGRANDTEVSGEFAPNRDLGFPFAIVLSVSRHPGARNPVRVETARFTPPEFSPARQTTGNDPAAPNLAAEHHESPSRGRGFPLRMGFGGKAVPNSRARRPHDAPGLRALAILYLMP